MPRYFFCSRMRSGAFLLAQARPARSRGRLRQRALLGGDLGLDFAQHGVGFVEVAPALEPAGGLLEVPGEEHVAMPSAPHR